MFWNSKTKSQAVSDAIKESSELDKHSLSITKSTTRRATSMVPVAATGSIHEIAYTGGVRFHQLLISLEGNQRTGCLRIVSPKRKARSAILIYRGRVVGCLYGSKKLDYQYLQQDAHRLAMADLAVPGNILDAYELPEELVLAAASMFAGETLQLSSTPTAQENFDEAVRKMSDMKLPGCIVVNNNEGDMLAMIYMCEGKLIGAFSAKDGWIEPTFDVAMSYIKTLKNTQVLASYMTVARPDPAIIGFSLTGLGDSSKTAIPARPPVSLKSYGVISSEARSYSEMQKAQGPRRSRTKQTRPSVRPDYIGEVFSVVP